MVLFKFNEVVSVKGTLFFKSMINVNRLQKTGLPGKAKILEVRDTGITINEMMAQLMEHEPAEIKIATLLFKPAAYIKRVHLDYVGFEVPKVFLLGYGLDYDGLGRNLTDIYKIVE